MTIPLSTYSSSASSININNNSIYTLENSDIEEYQDNFYEEGNLLPSESPIEFNKIINKLPPEIFENIFLFVVTSNQDFFNFQLVSKFFLDISDRYMERIFRTIDKEENKIYQTGRDINSLLTKISCKTEIKNVQLLNAFKSLLNVTFSGKILRGRPYHALNLLLFYPKETNLIKKLEYLDNVEFFSSNTINSKSLSSPTKSVVKLKDQENVLEEQISFIYNKKIDYLTQTSDPKLNFFLDIPVTALNISPDIYGREIIDACKRDDEETVRRMVRSQMIIGGSYSREEDIVHWAVQNRNLKYLKIFIEENVNLNKKDFYGHTPLLNCLSKSDKNQDDLAIMSMLIHGKANVHATNYSNNSALSLASQFGLLDIVKDLVKHGAEKQHQNDLLETPQYLAAANGHDKVIQFFWEDHEIDFEICDRSGNSVFHIAAISGREKVVNILTNKKTDKNILNQEVASNAIQRKINIESRNNRGQSPLSSVASTNHSKMFNLLLALNADKESADYTGSRPMHYAAQRGNLLAIDALIAAKASANEENKQKNTPLIIAAINNKPDAVQRLIQVSDFDPVINQEDRAMLTKLRNESTPQIIEIIRAHLKKKYPNPSIINSLGLSISCGLLEYFLQFVS